ncbi:hypothetical protein E2C01_000578 [Portunus trituberculatus]|uniref:Uncharacterized protein n=1 Tax=Portunus trituberculatus TaxID=210409 RepID=A0A5B7CFH7_PORTR|nr:hypothetical protein [Portunus trituberculatus]
MEVFISSRVGLKLPSLWVPGIRRNSRLEGGAPLSSAFLDVSRRSTVGQKPFGFLTCVREVVRVCVWEGRQAAGSVGVVLAVVVSVQLG